ncbi:MAG: TrkA family potassium uptake protein [Candidatus Omnitrophota bacterium]
MNVIIVGCGRVGARLARLLSEEGHNVTILDKNKNAFDQLGAAFNGVTLAGDGCQELMLKEAGIAKTDAFVAVTSSDNTNLMASQIAKKIFSVPKVIARVFDPKRARIYHELGLDVISGITLLAAMIRDKIIENRFTSYLVETGELGVLDIQVGDKLKGMKVQEANVPADFLVVAIERKKIENFRETTSVIIPQPDMILHKDDRMIGVVRTAALKKIKEIFEL